MTSFAPVRRTALSILLLAALAAAISPGLDGSGRQARRKISLIITGGAVVTMDGARRVLEPGAVAIDGTTVAAVGAPGEITSRFVASERIDAPGDVILPGLVNTHTHAAMVMFRGLADDLALMDWLQQYIFPGEARTVSPGMVRIGTRLAALEMIRSGTTTFADMYYFEEEVARATREAGLRGVLGQTIIGFPVADARTASEGLARAETFIKAFHGDPLITPVPAPHAVYTLDEASLRASRELADRYRVPLLIHLAETRDELKTVGEKHGGATPAGYLASIGVLGSPVVAAHCVWLNGDDIALMRAAGAAVSHNPESNMKLASGTAPVPKFLEAGLRVGLGTDGAASNNDLDMIEAMRQAALLHKLATGDPRAIPAEAALEMATIGGARALGLDGRIGSLEAGKEADVIVVSMRGARQTPMYNPVSHLVYVSRGDDVTATVVRGKVLMRDRRVRTLDEVRVLDDARRLAAKVKGAVAVSPR
jgi:5-methylthioadenosine/S-adenosylhomocysteine deaminase